MYKPKTTTLLLGAFILLNSLFSCSPYLGTYRGITIVNGQIPPDVAKTNFVLIGTLKGKKSYDKYLKKGFTKYTGQYKLAKSDEIESVYKDIDKYRFVLDHDREQTTYFDGTRTVYNKCYRFYIYDRKERKKYSSDVVTCSFYERIIGYVMAVDSLRKK